MLTGNLGDKLIPQNEILRDVSDLKALANLQESMEWLAVCLKGFFSSLPQSSSKCEWGIRIRMGNINGQLHVFDYSTYYAPVSCTIPLRDHTASTHITMAFRSP